ncbi:TrbC/VirB2 family protein [Trinickia acidisoli]|uniref:TrbC/VirB2 family protein n=1 Tax=Trinickia acidisoli TaxID=2767482 RepID=UPI001A8CE98C|nr:TrbC/VirB2 family protein [Trinickia acidisoli]
MIGETGIKRGYRGSIAAYLLCASVLLLFSGVADAQNTSAFNQLNAAMTNIITALQDAGAAVVTVAIVWAGYKMIFQHARWADVATVVLGAMLIGAASSIASWLVPAFT